MDKVRRIVHFKLRHFIRLTQIIQRIIRLYCKCGHYNLIGFTFQIYPMTLLGVLYFLGSKNAGFWLPLKWCFRVDSIFKSSLGPGSAAGEKGKKRVQIGKILGSEASQAVSPPIFFFSHFFFANANFFSFFPQCEAWSQATLNLEWNLISHSW